VLAGHSGVGGSEVLLEQVQLNFSFQNRFIIVLLCGLLVDNNTLLEMSIFKMSYSLTLMMVVLKTERHIFLIIIQSKAMKSLCWLF
jgi:hypothetical protein